MHRSLWLLVLFSVLPYSAVAQQRAAKPGAPSAPASATPLPTKATVDSLMRRMFGYDSAMTWNVAEIAPSEIPGVARVVVTVTGQQKNQVLYVMPDGQHAILGEVIPFGADPFAPARARLAKSTTGTARGPANAALTIVEFSDLQCPHCKQAQPVVDRLLADLPNARFVFQQFPLEMLHKWAFKAAQWADCIGRENNQAFWKFVQSVYDDQLEITEQNVDSKLRAHATAAGVPGAATAACVANPETARRVYESEELGRSLGVTGTPTLFVNGRKMVGFTSIPYETLKTIVQFDGAQNK